MYTIALLILSLPCDPPEWICYSKDLGDAFVQIAMNEELLADYECARWCKSSYMDLIGLIRRRRLELHDAPFLAAALPWGKYDKEYIKQCMEFNKRFQDHLENKIAFGDYLQDEYMVVLRETKTLWRAYDYANDVNNVNYSPHWRRLWLRELRDMLPAQMWNEALLPPPVPVWRFRNID